MLAGYGVVVLVALMSRLPALERGVGADRLARWHSRGGRIVVGLVLAHAWGALQAWEDSRGESLGLTLWHVLRLPWLIAATVGTVLMLLVAGMSMRAARRRVSFETWHTMHLLVYVAVALGFVHQLAGPDIAGHRLLQVAWALLYTGTVALVVQYRVLAPFRGATQHRDAGQGRGGGDAGRGVDHRRGARRARTARGVRAVLPLALPHSGLLEDGPPVLALRSKAELDQIAAHRRGARVHYLSGDVGPLTPQLLLWHAPDLLDRDVYLCGPPGLAAAVRRSLRQAGLPVAQLHEERFDL
jgi:predicted ferric reductase